MKSFDALEKVLIDPPSMSALVDVLTELRRVWDKQIPKKPTKQLIMDSMVWFCSVCNDVVRSSAHLYGNRPKEILSRPIKGMLREEEEMQLSDIVKATEALIGRKDYYGILSDMFEYTALSIAEAIKGTRSKGGSRVELYESWGDQKDKLEELKDMLVLFFAERVEQSEFDDYLGKLYMMSNTSSSKAGQFFTPFNVSELTAELSVNSMNTADPVITLHEPSCGSGGMVIAAAKKLWKEGINYTERLLVECGDIDRRCVHMTYIQLSLFGIPAVIFQRDTLTLQTWDEWHTPALVFNWLKFRKYVKGETK